MKFGDIKVNDALGAILAHSLKTPEGRLKKGTRLNESHLTTLRSCGIKTIIAGVLNADDILEDEAAARLAEALCGDDLQIGEATTGRANLHSARDGLFLVDHDCINHINLLDERITIATLEPWATVAPGHLTTTVKIIPYAVPEYILNQAVQIAKSGGPAVRVAAFTGKRAALVMTRQTAADNKLLTKGKRATADRLSRFGSTIDHEVTTDHTIEALAVTLQDLAEHKPELILILGATAIADRNDVVPSAVLKAGGGIEQFGMPVDPGNLLLLGRLGTSLVVGIPGCARSPKLNGFDWVLERIHANLDITSRDIARMGVGGLLKEIPSRPQPRELQKNAAQKLQRKVYGLILAAGQSRRMGKDNKLLATLGDKSLIKHTTEALEASCVEDIYVVTGHEREKIENEMNGHTLHFLHNPLFASGLSSTLKAGIAGLPDDADGVLVCLGDMPLTGSDVLDAIIEAFTDAPTEMICIPTFDGKSGNPVLLPRFCFSDIMKLEGDVGARALIALYAESVFKVPVSSNSILTDIDTPDDLETLIPTPRRDEKS